MKKIGIVGGGQLGRMLAMESADLDAEFFVLDPTPECPASAYAAQTVGDFTDRETVLAFGRDKDVLTFEIESANVEALLELEAAGVAIHPSPKTLTLIKDKLAQKDFLVAHGIPVAPYAPVEVSADVAAFAEHHGYPVVLKSRFGAYDGRGNRTVRSVGEIVTLMAELGDRLYVEAWVPFEKELAVVAARAQDGTVHTYPVVETCHADHICDVVSAPADVPLAVAARAEALAARILEVFRGAGVFGIELFLTGDGTVLVNEIAPRVHNSGHLTLGGANVSQFRQHVLALLGEPLVEPSLGGAAVVMKNILGEREGPAEPSGIEAAEALGARVEMYGKHATKMKRKMGHLVVVGATLAEARERAERARLLIHI